ncbi:sigma-70 family RNA polymerase sigma factor [bacterium D16-54]|nr:sigma-70 family RNA polymerase sigma factor [bacterium D16-54]RKJ12091.1 sigma-70 family RNA polymerase sigma factor [bacterium D16-56]
MITYLPYKKWNDVSFLRAKPAGKEETKKTNEKNSATRVYDMDGCFCLIIAILNGVGASTARRLYDNGPGQQSRGRPLPRGRPPDQTAAPGRTERNQRIYVLKKKGYSLEEISDILGCDSSTVKRNLKSEGGSVNHDTGDICGGDEDQSSGKGREPL